MSKISTDLSFIPNSKCLKTNDTMRNSLKQRCVVHLTYYVNYKVRFFLRRSRIPYDRKEIKNVQVLIALWVKEKSFFFFLQFLIHCKLVLRSRRFFNEMKIVFAACSFLFYEFYRALLTCNTVRCGMRKDKKILKDKKNLRFPLKKKKNGIRKLLFVVEIFGWKKKRKETLLFNILQNHSGKGVLSDQCVPPQC